MNHCLTCASFCTTVQNIPEYEEEIEHVKKSIEELRDKQVSRTINQRAKYDKTSKSKDIIIMAKDKKIKGLEEENKKLKEQLEVLRGKLYENM